MSSGAGIKGPTAGADQAGQGIALRFQLASGACSVPLNRLHHLAGYATLTGEPDDYFLGWLSMRGELVPVFDLNRVVCDRATPQNFGARIMILQTSSESPTRYIGLLAAGITDTIETGSESVEPFDPDSYLPMLYNLTPMVPSGPSHRA